MLYPNIEEHYVISTPLKTKDNAIVHLNIGSVLKTSVIIHHFDESSYCYFSHENPIPPEDTEFFEIDKN